MDICGLAMGIDGVAMLGEIVPISELQWGILVEQPQEQAYAAVRDTWVTGLKVGKGLTAGDCVQVTREEK